MSRMSEQEYRRVERKLYAEYGVAIKEHFVEVRRPAASIRVLEIGKGEPLLLIHGSPNNAATWVSLAAQMPGRRCLLLERPGAGLSSAVERWGNHRADSAAIVEAALDYFGIDRIDIAGSSFGGLYAYNFALTRPQRVRSLIQVGSPGGPAILGIPAIFRFLSLPLPKPMVNKALCPDVAEARKMYVQIGHKDSVEDGTIPDVVFEWYSSLLCNTDTVEHLVREIRAIATPLGYRPASRIEDDTLARLNHPLLYLWGDRDAFAKSERADALAALSPATQIEHFEQFGHLPWYDDPALIAARMEEFLAARP